MSDRIAGVLGGMGPAATVHFIARVQALSGAVRDQDHVRLIVDLNPRVPDRNAASAGAGQSPEAVLAAMARGLHSAGADFIVMPCNAAHSYAKAIRDATPLPFVNIIEETAAAVAKWDVARVGVLAAGACIEADLYQSALRERRIESIAPSMAEQARFMDVLYRIKSGDLGDGVRAEMKALAENLANAGAETVIAGCTEIPLVLDYAELSVPVVDSLEVLAERTVAIARGEAP